MAGFMRVSLVVFFLAVLGLSPAAADDPARQKVLDLNKVTGTDVLKGAMKDLLEGKAETKQLIAEGVALVKEKKDALSYNGALLLALAAAEQKDFAASEVLFRICMDQAAKLHSPQKILQSYGGLIDLFYDGKKYEESAKLCRELLELKTDDGKERIVLIAVPDRFGGTDFIEDDKFDTTKNLRSGVHRLLIQAIAKQGKYEQALKLADNLIKASKNNNWFEVQLKAWVHREAGQLVESAKVYEEVIERINKDPDLEAEEKEGYQERYKYLLSNIYVDLKQIDKASEQLEWLLQRKPDDPGFNNDLGYIWADHDMKLEEAEKLIRKAIDLDRKRRKVNPKLDPDKDRDNGAYLDSLGWVLYKQKNFKEAKEVLLKAVEDKNAQHIEIYDHLADTLLALNENEAALTAWRKGLEFVTDSRRDQQIKAKVQKKIDQQTNK